MIPITGGRLLLPNATIAEVVSYTTPEKVDNAPEWLLGRLPWRGWRLPLFSFAMLSGSAPKENYTSARVAVLKALGGNAKLPFIALLTQGFPRLTTVTQDSLISAGGEEGQALGVRSHVLVRADHAIIPDLGGIEAMVAEAIGA